MGQKIKKEKADNIKTKKHLIIIKMLIVVVVCLYLGFTVINLIKNPTKTFVIEKDTLSLEEDVVGYIIRDEKILEGTNAGVELNQTKSEGDRVAKGEVVSAYSNNSQDELKNKIAELDSQINEALEKQKNTIYPNDIKALDDQIEKELKQVEGLNNIQKLIEYKESINSSIEKKARISGEKSPAGSYIKELIDKKTDYERQLNASQQYIKSDKAGIVSYRIDDLENILLPNEFYNIDINTLNELPLKTGQLIPESKEKVKIIDNFKCYLITEMTSDKSKEAKVGDKLSLRINNGNEIDAEIEYISEKEKSRIIIFKITENVDKLINYRKISFDVIWWSYEGLKVPKQSIINRREYTVKNSADKETTIVLGDIIRNKLGYEEKITVKIEIENEKFALINNIKTEEKNQIEELKNEKTKSIAMYDEIMENPK